MINVVIDLSHHNSTVDFTQVKAAGIVGVMHKATQGLTFEDPTYQSRKTEALAAGLLWGAYHFGTGDDAVAQAQYFLSFVSPGPSDLLALDLEADTGGTSMTLAQAEQFTTQVQQATGRWPGVYGGSYLKQLLSGTSSAVLASSWLWLSEYGSTANIPSNWPTWTMWQYTDGTNGPEPHSITGVGDCDRDSFNGSLAGLKKLWGSAA